MTTVSERTQDIDWPVETGWARAYERHLVPSVFGPWGQRLIDTVAPGPGGHVLDVACGTGICARLAAERVGPSGRVVGVDVSPAMLAVAEEAAAGTQPPIQWLEGDAGALPVSEAAFDVVVCQQSLQFFPDRPTVLAEIRRAAKPGGRVAVSVWLDVERCPGFARLADVLADHVGPDVAAAVRIPFCLSDAEELRGLLVGAGLEGVRITRALGEFRYLSAERFLRDYATIAPWLLEPLGALDEGGRRALVGDYTAAMDPYTDDEGILFPLEAHVAVAWR